MGWGCYKHKMDAGSESWQGVVKEATPENYYPWGRDGEVCPACWMELERERNLLQRFIKVMLGHNAKLCTECDGKTTVVRPFHWPVDSHQVLTCPTCNGAGLVGVGQT